MKIFHRHGSSPQSAAAFTDNGIWHAISRERFSIYFRFQKDGPVTLRALQRDAFRSILLHNIADLLEKG